MSWYSIDIKKLLSHNADVYNVIYYENDRDISIKFKDGSKKYYFKKLDLIKLKEEDFVNKTLDEIEIKVNKMNFKEKFEVMINEL